MKDLKFICAQPDDTYYTWQVHLWLESLRKIGHSDKAIVLIFIPSFREKNNKWQQVIDLYPESEFVFYKDVEGISNYLGLYIPILRPYCLKNYFHENPSMKDKAVLYCDSDVIFTDKLNITEFIDDDICYLSNTNSYINASYFDSKIHQVLPEKLDEYKTRDILEECTGLAGISREIAEANNEHSGGAQYLLKGIDGLFWDKVLADCLTIRTHLLNVNGQFFKDENSGFQSWCTDMWSVLWNLWYFKKETKVIHQMDFAWSTDHIKRLETAGILHNAGIGGDNSNGYPAFYKGKYHQGGSPFDDPHLEVVMNNEISKQHCTHYYLSQLIDLKNKYNLNY